MKGHSVSEETRLKISKTLSHINPSYDAIHAWLVKNYGKPQICENSKCLKKSKNYEWALKKGKTHAKNRSHYRRLCKPCHTLYDDRGWMNKRK